MIGDESMDQVRTYKLHKGDIFSIDLNTFMSSSIFWNNPCKILKFVKYKRKWWKFWKPRYTYYVRIEYEGE